MHLTQNNQQAFASKPGLPASLASTYNVNRSLTIGEHVINDESECFVIAEIGHNHQGSMDLCKQLFDEAKAAGCQAVKLQKRDNKALFTEAFYNSPYNSENAYGPTYGLHREALEFNREQFIELKEYADKLGLIFFSTAFDMPSADFLAELDMPAYKIASGDLTNIPLLRYVAAKGKPMIMSTGAGTMADVQRAVEAILPINPQLAVLQCVTTYPTAYEDLNLNVIPSYREAFPEVVIGWSSHDNGIAMAVAAYMLGARVVEKHFTLNRAMKGTDHAFSLEPTGMRKMVRDMQRCRVALGCGIKQTMPQEQAAKMKMGKKIVAARDLEVGRTIREEDLTYKSPGDGLAPYHADAIIGRTLKKPLVRDEEMTLEHVGMQATAEAPQPAGVA